MNAASPPSRTAGCSSTILFIIFDVEAAFLYPWAVSLREIGWTGWLAMMGFLAELLLGFAYAWKKGALEWE